MNTSFELLSSMSPKFNKSQKPIKKGPTILALKKHLRKSLLVTSAKNESIVVVDSSSSSLSDNCENFNESPIIISDSEISSESEKSEKLTSVLKDKKCVSKTKTESNLSEEKLLNIQYWVDDVNNAKKNLSGFTEVSAVFGDDEARYNHSETNVAVSSTLLESKSKRFDELFIKKQSRTKCDISSERHGIEVNINNVQVNSTSIHNKSSIEINDSLISDDMDLEKNFQILSIDDSFKLDKNESLHSRIMKKNICSKLDTSYQENTPELPESHEYENLLDSLYGNSWREKKDEVLPLSEPRRKTVKKIDNKPPNTERRAKKIPDKNSKACEGGFNLLRIMQKVRFGKALESPWTESLKKVCDSDTSDSDTSRDYNVLPPLRLNFNDETENTNTENKLISDSDRCNKNLKNKSVNKSKKDLNSKTEKVYSFLASLSGSVPVEKCDLSALIYRNNFQKHRDVLAEKLFKLYNEKVFENALPEDTVIEWNDRLRGTAGICTCKKITRRTGAIERTAKIRLSTKVLDSADRLRDTLIHEMCHAATWIVNKVSDGHGPYWKSWASRAMKTFPELPPINRCHNYAINTKYTYKCTGCGYSIGRHSKSLDVQRKRCGYCYGTFEVLLNKTNKQGETKSVPVTPKKNPSGFALFVKENYATYKTPDMKHGDVMKFLGKKFADLKVNKT